MEKSRQYNIYKAAAMVLVVFAHASNMYTANGVISPANASGLLALLTEFIYSFHMPFFMAVSGMVYGYCADDLEKYDNYGKFLKGKAKRLLVPYLVIGLLVVAPTMVLLKLTDQSFLRYCAEGILLTKNTRHLWFIIVLFEVFVIFGASKKLLQKLNPLIIAAGLAAAYIILSLLGGRFLTYQLKSNLFYFFAGYLFNRYFDKLFGIIRHPATILVSLLGLLVLFRVENIIVGYICAFLGSIAFAGACAYVPRKITRSAMFGRLSANGFGIYLFHPMIIYWLYYLLGGLDVSPVLLCLAIAVISYFLSLAISILLRKNRITAFLIGG